MTKLQRLYLPTVLPLFIGRKNPAYTFGLPTLPESYQVLHVAGEPPIFQEVEWGKFHEDLQAALSEEIVIP